MVARNKRENYFKYDHIYGLNNLPFAAFGRIVMKCVGLIRDQRGGIMDHTEGYNLGSWPSSGITTKGWGSALL